MSPVTTDSDLGDVRRVLKRLNDMSAVAIDQHTDNSLIPWLFNPKEAAAVTEVLAPAMESDDLLSPADRLVLANFVIEHAKGVEGFKALVSTAKLTLLLSRMTGKYVSAVSHGSGVANAMMTDTPALRTWILDAAARDSKHLPGDETTQDVCARAGEELEHRYSA